MSHHDTDTTVLEPDPADDLLDEEWLSNSHRPSRWRIALLGALGVALAFFGGVQVQKHFGTTGSESSAAAPGGAFTPGELPEGMPSIGDGTMPDAAAGAPGASESGGDANTSSVIGEVTRVKGNTWVVTDLGGTKHTVIVDADTRLLEEKSLDEGDVSKGTVVTISGAAGESDALTATSITVR